MADEREPGTGDEGIDDLELPDDEPLPGDEGEDGDGAGEGDEIKGEDGDGAAAGDAEPPARRGGPDRGQRDARRSREAKLQREVDELKRRVNAPGPAPDPQTLARNYEADENRKLTAAQEAENAGTIGAVARYWHERTVRESRDTVAFNRNQMREDADRDRFDALCDRKPHYDRVRDWVEDAIQNHRRNGNFEITRQALARYRLGELLDERGGKALEQRRQRADAGRQRQTVRAPRAGSDAGGSGRRGRNKPESEWNAEDYERNAGGVFLTGKGTPAG